MEVKEHSTLLIIEDSNSNLTNINVNSSILGKSSKNKKDALQNPSVEITVQKEYQMSEIGMGELGDADQRMNKTTTAGFKTSKDKIEIAQDERVQDSLENHKIVTLNLTHQETDENVLKKLTKTANQEYFGTEL